MKATELLKKLGDKILGKKMNASTADEHTVDKIFVFVPPDATTPETPVLDGLGDIQLHEYWRN
jgi:hypothetical protein